MSKIYAKQIIKGSAEYSKAVQGALRLSVVASLSIGIHPEQGKQKYRGGPTVAQVASWHARGAGHLPKRDPVGDWTRRRGRFVKATIDNIVEDGLIEAYGAEPESFIKQDLQKLGQRSVNEIRRSFQTLRPLQYTTIRRKGNTRILVETGRLYHAIQYRAVAKRRRVVIPGIGAVGFDELGVISNIKASRGLQNLRFKGEKFASLKAQTKGSKRTDVTRKIEGLQRQEARIRSKIASIEKNVPRPVTIGPAPRLPRAIVVRE